MLIMSVEDRDWVNRTLRGIVNYNWSRRNEEFIGSVVTAKYKISNSRDSINAAWQLVSERLGL